MNTKLTLLLAFLSLSLMTLAQQPVSIIPAPVSIQLTEGNFEIDSQTSIRIENEKKELKPAAAFLAARIQAISG